MGAVIAAEHVAPARGHPAKYYFAGTLKAGAAAFGSQRPPNYAAAPACAGATVWGSPRASHTTDIS